jgi:hypothetical protein
MLDGKTLSAAIRKKKKNLLRPDMDSAGQEALDPTAVDDLKQNERVSVALEDAGVEGADHAPPSDAAMGEDESSQDVKKLQKISSRILGYFKGL